MNGLIRPGFVAGGAAVGIGAIGRVGAYPFIRDGMLQGFGIEKGEKPKSIMISAGFLSGALGYMCCSPIYQVKVLA